MRYSSWFLVVLLASFHSGVVDAARYKKEPPPLYKKIAAQNKIPAKLFYALILNESRSAVQLKQSNQMLPWPWTVNYKGKGLYFKTRLEAYEFVKPILNSGGTAGIGLGQIEWRWHKHKFKNLWEAFEPEINLQVAAQYFRAQYDRKECNSWKQAVGCYHRSAQKQSDKKIAAEYTSRVLRIWKQII